LDKHRKPLRYRLRTSKTVGAPTYSSKADKFDISYISSDKAFLLIKLVDSSSPGQDLDRDEKKKEGR